MDQEIRRETRVELNIKLKGKRVGREEEVDGDEKEREEGKENPASNLPFKEVLFMPNAKVDPSPKIAIQSCGVFSAANVRHFHLPKEERGSVDLSVRDSTRLS